MDCDSCMYREGCSIVCTVGLGKYNRFKLKR